MISLSAILLIVWCHFIADFLLQTRKMGTLKSSSMHWLMLHIGAYTVGIMPLSWYLTGSLGFAFINGVAHFFVDIVTSKLTTICYKKEKMFLFWSVIGADQALHLTILFVTYFMLT